MLGLLILLLYPTVAMTVIIDKACTTGGKFNIRAVMCSNLYPDASCQALYGSPPVIGSDVDRNPACFTTNVTSIDHELKSLSSEICPRQCGYCCQSPEYNCQNSARPRVSCDQVTHRMCRNPVWEQILIEDCPNMCGFCLRGCVDNVPDCAIDKTICRRMGMEEFVEINCRRTCGYCQSSSTTLKSKCSHFRPDNNPNCAKWAANGFCQDEYFTLKFRRQHCATTCEIC
ncbi:unnamed protein product [Auanema sp. JU1783]|nr:unnamed protein product [Auanema sp. JU1783]